VRYRVADLHRPPPLVLASASPRRTALLDRWGIPHLADAAHIPEEVLDGETPQAHVERLAREKAAAVATRHPGALVLAGDTVVVLDGEILGKPRDPGHARAMLHRLSGREHLVVTGLALACPEPGGAGAPFPPGHDRPPPASQQGFVLSRWDEARVVFRTLDEADIEGYLATEEPLDKAGGYGIQGFGGTLVTRVEGDYYTVVGLPASGLVTLLREAGWRCGFGSLVPV
jgi:septum formation protein